MKKSRLFLVAIGTLFLTNVFAQLEADIKMGLNNTSVVMSGISESVMPSTVSHTSFTFGTDIAYALDRHFSIGTGVHYSRAGFNVEEGTAFNLAGIDVPVGVELRVTENMLSLPLYLKYTYPTQWADLYAKGGASISTGIGGRAKTVATSWINVTLDDRDIGYSAESLFNRNSLNMDLAVGAGFPYGNGKLITEIGVSKGLTDKIENNLLDASLSYNTLFAKVGYSIKF